MDSTIPAVPTTLATRNLIIRREEMQTIVINDTTIITVLKVEGKRVKLSIQAPDGVRVWRGEIYAESGQAHAPKPEPVAEPTI